MVLAAVALLLPTSLAASVDGELSVESLTVPERATVEGRPLAALLLGGTASSRYALHTDHLHVTEHEVQYVTVGTANVPAIVKAPVHRNFTRATLEATKVSVDSMLGFSPTGDASLTSLPVAPVESSAALISTLSDGAGSSDHDNFWWYHKEIRQPHALTQITGALQLEGAWVIKIRGPRVVIDSDQGKFSFETGIERPSAAETRVRWLVVESASLSQDLATGSASVVVALSSGTQAWTGKAVVERASGSIRSEEAAYHAQTDTATLEGVLRASFTPHANEGVPRLQLAIEGDLVQTSLAPVPAGPLGGSSYGIPWTFLLAVVGSGLGFGLLRQRRSALAEAGTALPADAVVRRAPQIAPKREQAQKLVEEAWGKVASADWHEAADLFAQALWLDPTIPGVAVQQGYCLAMAGEFAAAIRVLSDAAKEAQDGEAQMHAAACALAMEQEALAEDFLLDALNEPGLSRPVLLQILTERQFVDLWHFNPRLRPAIERVKKEYGLA